MHALGSYTPRGTLVAKPVRRRGDSLPLVPRRRLPELGLSRLITTACTLAVYASPRRVTPSPRKTRFRWVASPCRVGFGPTGSTTKGFRFCLLHVPSSLPRLGLARGTYSAPGQSPNSVDCLATALVDSDVFCIAVLVWEGSSDSAGPAAVITSSI